MNNEDAVKQEQEPEKEESCAPVPMMGTQGFAYSPEMDKIAEALAKAQGAIQAAVRDAKNPFHKSTYADLCSIWDACREPLSKNGLAVLQPTEIGPKGSVDVITMVIHSGSGQWIRGRLRAIPGRREGGKFVVSVDPQSVGSAITYMRRYGLAAMVGVAPQGEAGMETAKNRLQPSPLRRRKTLSLDHRAKAAVSPHCLWTASKR